VQNRPNFVCGIALSVVWIENRSKHKQISVVGNGGSMVAGVVNLDWAMPNGFTYPPRARTGGGGSIDSSGEHTMTTA
jgi:hypothetical protein